MICDVCHVAMTAAAGIGYEATHHPTWRSLRDSVELGCSLCSDLWATIEPIPDTTASLSATSSQPIDGSHEKSSSTREVWPLKLEIFFEGGRPRRGWLNIRGKLGMYGLIPTRNVSTLSSSTKSVETMSMAKQWLADCTCYKPSQAQAWYPTRLLDCGVDGGESTRLVETSSNAVNGPYMTLSHCWGDVKDTLRLTTDNYAEYLGEIPMTRLPQLYQDAVYVTKQLGVRYIWIDSVCIIQEGDDQADWNREVGLMEKVYSHTFCNISALQAPDSHHSLFSTRNLCLGGLGAIETPYKGQRTTFLIQDSEYWENEVENTLLHTRGWVLQERVLSPRVLHFGRRQILWECTGRYIAEVYGDAQKTDRKRFKELFQHDPDASSTQVASLYKNWQQIIEIFSRCRLTFPSDKLVALSAVAKHMSVLLQDEYCAGLWRGSLEEGLGWFVNGFETARPESVQETSRGSTAVYRAPSWSWASVDYPISHDTDIDNMELKVWSIKLIRIEEVHIDHLTRGFSTGLVKGGWLRLRAALKALTLVPRSQVCKCYPAYLGMSCLGARVVGSSYVAVIDGFESLWDGPCFSVLLDAPYEYHTRVFSGEAGREMQMYCLPTMLYGFRGIWNMIRCCFLLLRQVGEDHRGPIFRRIGLGVFELSLYREDFARNWAHLCRALGGPGAGRSESWWDLTKGESLAQREKESEEVVERLLAGAQSFTIV
ncbi:hypothetical protein RB599_000342 [Gaeumannomyces hyphopodioides]